MHTGVDGITGHRLEQVLPHLLGTRCINMSGEAVFLQVRGDSVHLVQGQVCKQMMLCMHTGERVGANGSQRLVNAGNRIKATQVRRA